MPIRVKCRCQQQFDARDDLAGKTVRCPKCGSPITIPSPAAAAGAARQAAPAVPSMADLLDEVGVKPRVATGCPGCGAAYPPDAVLCVECGFNFRTGRRLETKVVSTGPTDGVTDGHGVNSEFLIQKAREEMEAERLMQKKLISFGIPWWGYLLILIGLISFIVGMGSLPQATAMYIAAVIMWVAGGLLAVVGRLWLIYASTKVSAVWVIVTLVPLGEFVFAFTNWDESAGPFAIFMGGLLVIGLGFAAWWLSFQLGKPEGEAMLQFMRMAIPV
jgi:hypothetical protein